MSCIRPNRRATVIAAAALQNSMVCVLLRRSLLLPTRSQLPCTMVSVVVLDGLCLALTVSLPALVGALHPSAWASVSVSVPMKRTCSDAPRAWKGGNQTADALHCVRSDSGGAVECSSQPHIHPKFSASENGFVFFGSRLKTGECRFIIDMSGGAHTRQPVSFDKYNRMILSDMGRAEYEWRRTVASFVKPGLRAVQASL